MHANKRKYDVKIEESSDSASSTDSVKQVLECKYEYNTTHIKDFEVSKLKSRFSKGTALLKKQINMLN